MADDSSNLRAEIAFLKNLIKFHKQTTPQDSGSGVHSHTVNNDSSKNSRSFSWQRAKQQESETKQPLLRPPLNHVKGQARKVNSSYSLDRRKMNSNTSGQNTTVTTANVPVTPGSSGLSQTLKDTKSFSDSKGVLKQNDTRTTLSIPQAQKSVNMTRNSSSSQPTLGLTAKNPYVLNKRGTFPVSSVKAVAQKSDLKWTKPRATSVISSEDSRSHSDSELYTKKSLLPSSGVLAGMPFTKVKSSTVIHHKAPSTSNVQGSFKWSKTRPSISSSKEPEKSTKKSKPARSKLKWTKSGAQVEVKKQLNPYILRKEITEGGSAGQRQRLTLPKTKKLENPRQRYSTPQNQTAHVRRNKVQLNMESVASKKLLSRSSAGFVERRQRTVQGESPVVTRYSVVRSKRKQAPIKAQKLNKVVVIGGVAYKTSSNKLTKAKASSAEKESGKGSKKVGKLTKTVIIQGEKFVSDSKGKTLQRINKAPRRTSLNEPSSSKVRQTPSGRRRSSNARMVILRTPTTLVRSKLNNTPSKTLASRVLRRNIHNARLYKKNKNEPASQQYCMFYNRFGKCNKRNTCPYIHDPSKVAVCTKFLRGRCKNVDGSCPFSHKIDPDKMPVCQFFLRGKCSNDNCPYSHVNVSKKAKVCEDFLKGFCARGQQCNKKHILECEEFSRTGKCSQGSKCKLMHKARKPIAAHKRKSSYKEEQDNSKLSKLDLTRDEGFLPLIAGTSDSEQISAQHSLGNTQEETKEMAAEPVVIRPRFLKPKEAEIT